MARITTEDVQALLNIRGNLIEDHQRILDGAGAANTALCKQKDVAVAFSRAIKGIEEVLTEAGQIKFTEPVR